MKMTRTIAQKQKLSRSTFPIFFYNVKQSTENISYKLVQISCMTTNVQNSQKRTIKKFPVKRKTRVDPAKRRPAEQGALFTDEQKTLQSNREFVNKSMPILLCRPKYV